MFNNKFVPLVVTIFALMLSREAEAQSDYNFPSRSKVEIVRDPNGQSYLYLLSYSEGLIILGTPF